MAMDSDYEKRLEAEIERELSGLPDLTAPSTLVARVMRAVEGRASVSWYRRPWLAWPLTLRAASLTALLALFGGICFAGWEWSHAGPDFVSHRFSSWLSGFGVLWNVVSALIGALGLALNQLGPVVLVAYLAALTFGCATCLGLGTLCLRLAVAQNGRYRL